MMMPFLGLRSSRERFNTPSARIVRDIFAECFEAPVGTVLDMTYGFGGCWAWPYEALGIELTTSDLNPGGFPYVEAKYRWDFRALPLGDRAFDVVIFDPPHTSAGKSEWAWRYGIDRTRGGPRNTREVREWLLAGVQEALRVADLGVIVKYKDCVESGRQPDYWSEVRSLVAAARWAEVGTWTNWGERPQPDGRTYSTQVKPAVYFVAKPVGARNRNGI